MSHETLTAILSIVLPGVLAGGAAWGGIKVSLNGTKEQVKETAAQVRRIDDRTHEFGMALVRVEQRQENFEQRLDRFPLR